MKKLLAVLVCLAAISVVVLLVLDNLAQAAPQGPWIRHSDNPVLSPGGEGAWDQNAVYYANVISDGTTYRMWYTGYDSDWVARIGYAESPDGVNWTKHAGNPVINPGSEGSWDSARTAMPTVVKVDGTYRMWYTGYDADWVASIGYAESADGITWIKQSGNPVLGPGQVGTWDDAAVRSPTVLYRDGSFHMWYHGWGTQGWDTPGRIGYASSPDGIEWTRSLDNPVLAGGTSDSWEYPAVFGPSVLFDPEAAVYRMWYTAFNNGVDGGKNRFGYAVSADGAHWTKHSLNPVFYPGEPGSWDAGDMHGPCVILEGNTFKMWYAAHDGSFGIGHAVAEPGAPIVGHVYDQSTDPLLGARIYALDDELNVVGGAVSRADGRYAIVDLPDGDYYLETSADGYGREYYDDSYNILGATPVSVTVPVTTAGIDFTLSSEGAVTGHVYGPEGATPLEGAMVELEPTGGGRPLGTTSASDGAYVVDGLAIGSYDAWSGHSSYLAEAASTPISVGQPGARTQVDFTLLGPYFPLEVNAKWIYAWSNDTYNPEPVVETIRVTEQQGNQSTLGARHDHANGRFWINEQASGLVWSGWSTSGGPSFPLPMYMLLYYAYVPTDFLKQPLLEGEDWLGSGRTESSLPSHLGFSAVVSQSETVAVPAGTFTDALHLQTVISGTNDFLSGERDMWFSPGVGLIKLSYNHDDGSVTTAELVGGPYSHRVCLPVVLRQFSSSPPTPTPELTGRIAFQSKRTGNNDVFVVRPDGSELTKLTNDPAADFGPAWSPDANYIVFTSQRDGNDEIYLMNADGTGVKRLTNDPALDRGPAWSPDGTRIAFNSDRDGELDIYVMNADGTNLTKLLEGPGWDYAPHWSLDGQKIAFTSRVDDEFWVYRVNADGTGLTRWLAGVGARWSPDGRRVAFHRAGEIWVMNADGSDQQRHSVPEAYGIGLCWSPDSQRIAYMCMLGTGTDYETREICIMNADGTDQQRLTDNGVDDAYPDWAP